MGDCPQKLAGKQVEYHICSQGFHPCVLDDCIEGLFVCRYMFANALMMDGKRDGVCLNLSMAPHRSFQKLVLYTVETLAILLEH